MGTPKIFDVAILSMIALLAATLACVDIRELWDSTQSGKFIVFSYAGTILLILISLRAVVVRRPVVRLNAVDVLLLVLLGATLLNRMVKGESYSRNLYELPGLVLVYVAVRQLKERTWFVLFAGIIAGGVIQGVYGLLQFYGYVSSGASAFGICGGFFNPGPYAGYLASVFPVLLGCYLRKNKAFLMGGMAVLLLALAAALSRAAWLAVVVSTLFLLSCKYDIRDMFKRVFDSKLKVRVSVVVAVVLLVVAGYFLYSFKQGSADGRLLVWKITLRMVADNPVSGVGPDRFVARYMDYQEAYFQQGDPRRPGLAAEALHADNIYYAFNDPLQFVAENGLIGLVLLAGIVWALLRIRMRMSPWFVIAAAGLLSVGVFSFFSYPMEILPIKLDLVIFLAVLSCGGGDLKRIELPAAGRVVRIGVVAGLMLAGFGISREIRVIYDGYYDWESAMSLYQENFFDESVGFYRRAYPVFRENGDFLMHYGKALSMERSDREALDKLHEARRYLNTSIIQTAMGDSYRSLKRYDSAEAAYQHAVFMLPDRLYPKYLLAKLYAESGQQEKAVAAAREILRLRSRTSSEATDEIDREMQQLLNQYRVPR